MPAPAFPGIPVGLRTPRMSGLPSLLVMLMIVAVGDRFVVQEPLVILFTGPFVL